VQTVRTPVLDIAYEATGPAEGPSSGAAAWVPRRHPRLRRGCAAARGRRLPCDRALSAWLWFDPLSRPGDTPIGRASGAGPDLLDLIDALDLGQPILAGYDWGGRAACVVGALWPERIAGLVSVTGYNIQNIANATRP
jgi:pimeloyl-ACP methyl ester carboxylesterase